MENESTEELGKVDRNAYILNDMMQNEIAVIYIKSKGHNKLVHIVYDDGHEKRVFTGAKKEEGE